MAIGLTKRTVKKRSRAVKKSLKFIRRDLQHAFIGLAISIILAILVNPIIQEAIQELILGVVK